MTPAELRDAAERLTSKSEAYLGYDDYGGKSEDAVSLAKHYLKLTDPTPIDEAFAKRVNATRLFEVYQSSGHWCFESTDDTRGLGTFTTVTTRGDVYTMLWRAGLLDQVEETT